MSVVVNNNRQNGTVSDMIKERLFPLVPDHRDQRARHEDPTQGTGQRRYQAGGADGGGDGVSCCAGADCPKVAFVKTNSFQATQASTNGMETSY